MTDHLDAPTRRRVPQTGTAAEAVTAFGATARVPAHADPPPGAAVTTSQSCTVAGACEVGRSGGEDEGARLVARAMDAPVRGV